MFVFRIDISADKRQLLRKSTIESFLFEIALTPHRCKEICAGSFSQIDPSIILLADDVVLKRLKVLLGLADHLHGFLFISLLGCASGPFMNKSDEL